MSWLKHKGPLSLSGFGYLELLSFYQEKVLVVPWLLVPRLAQSDAHRCRWKHHSKTKLFFLSKRWSGDAVFRAGPWAAFGKVTRGHCLWDKASRLFCGQFCGQWAAEQEQFIQLHGQWLWTAVARTSGPPWAGPGWPAILTEIQCYQLWRLWPGAYCETHQSEEEEEEEKDRYCPWTNTHWLMQHLGLDLWGSTKKEW